MVSRQKKTPSEDQNMLTVDATAVSEGSERSVELSYTDVRVIGNGSFGVVYKVTVCETGEVAAIKKVLQDKRFKNRELQVMKLLNHCNVIQLMYFFYTNSDTKDNMYLNLVMEYLPEVLYKVAKHYRSTKKSIPIVYVKVYLYQLFRSLAYIHSLSICHRDVKPQNLLLSCETGVLKLCDFGSAKELVRGETNISYICSRYYRAPELIFGAVDYTTKIDVWSAGCILAELLLGQPIFPGDSGVDQLVKIIKILGTPTKEQINDMNPNYTEFRFPKIKCSPWSKVFRSLSCPDAIDLISRVLNYTPMARLTPLQACAHTFFDELRNEDCKMPNGQDLPPLFNFMDCELKIQPELNAILIPQYIQNNT